MKILYFTGQLKNHGGIERVLSLKMNYLAEVSKQEVFLITYEQNELPHIYPLSDKIIKYDIPINYNIDYTREGLFSYKNIKKIPAHYSKFKKIIKRIKPNVIIIPNFGFEFYFLPFLNQKIPIIREFHDSRLLKFSSKKNRLKIKIKIKTFIDNYIESKYDKLVVLTPNEISYFKSSNVINIPNPIKLTADLSTVDNKIAISIGRITEVKRFDNLIIIWAKLKRKFPDWKLYIYGDGDNVYSNYLNQLIKDNNLIENVFINKSTNKINEKLIDASIYVCTSRTESFGMTIIEAMNCGLPVVSYNCPFGPQHLIDDGQNGFLIDDGDQCNFQNKLGLLMNDYSLRKIMGHNAKNKACYFSEDIILKQWMDLFKSIKR
jgi:glycosyltransferase involved in cell wall biosynthesis